MADAESRIRSLGLSPEEEECKSQGGLIFREATRKPMGLLLNSVTHTIPDIRREQLYTRLVRCPSDWEHVCPIGQPDAEVRLEDRIDWAVLKFGNQGPRTGRQAQHDIDFKNSMLLDSFYTTSYSLVELRVKDYLANNHYHLRYEGKHVDKKIKDTELLLIRSQEEYAEIANVIQKIINEVEAPASMMQEQEKTKQLELQLRIAEVMMRKADAQARAVEAQLALERLRVSLGAEPELAAAPAPEPEAAPEGDPAPPEAHPELPIQRQKIEADHNLRQAQEYVQFMLDHNGRHPRKNSNSKKCRTAAENREKRLGAWLYNYARSCAGKCSIAPRPEVDAYLKAKLGAYWTERLALVARDKDDAQFVKDSCEQARDLVAYFTKHGAMPDHDGAQKGLLAIWYRWVRVSAADKQYGGLHKAAIAIVRESGMQEKFASAVSQRKAKQSKQAEV